MSFNLNNIKTDTLHDVINGMSCVTKYLCDILNESLVITPHDTINTNVFKYQLHPKTNAEVIQYNSWFETILHGNHYVEMDMSALTLIYDKIVKKQVTLLDIEEHFKSNGLSSIISLNVPVLANVKDTSLKSSYMKDDSFNITTIYYDFDKILNMYQIYCAIFALLLSCSNLQYKSTLSIHAAYDSYESNFIILNSWEEIAKFLHNVVNAKIPVKLTDYTLCNNIANFYLNRMNPSKKVRSKIEYIRDDTCPTVHEFAQNFLEVIPKNK